MLFLYTRTLNNYMKDINIGKIIGNKRKEKGITQDQLASYLGVTKASVSKWETEQSYPDITFLPQLATYFNISMDDLMGYTPQMSKENIKDLYHKLSSDFSAEPFNQVLDQCHKIIKKYYSCFPLLMQMAVLFCNHHMLAKSADDQKRVLEEAAYLCFRIKTESEDVWLIKEATSLEATSYLMLGQPQNVLEILSETIRPITNDETALAQAYILLGNSNEANKVLQISMYQHLLLLVGAANTLLLVENEQFEEILNRILSVTEVFNLEKLHPNTMALTFISAAQVYCNKGNQEKALDMLEKYSDLCITKFFPCFLHGDSFFTQLDSWLSEFDLGTKAVRSEEVIKESMVEGITSNPAFTSLKDHPRYKAILKSLKSNLGEK